MLGCIFELFIKGECFFEFFMVNFIKFNEFSIYFGSILLFYWVVSFFLRKDARMNECLLFILDRIVE